MHHIVLNNKEKIFSVAPMMECTDRHGRYFLRLLTKRAFLYTEMTTTGGILRGDTARFLDHDPIEQPLALQLGGSDPATLAAAARCGAVWGYREINLNVGCPSNKVTAGGFGASLMVKPGLVSDCVKAMSDTISQPITVKTRIGIDNFDSKDQLDEFVEIVARAGCNTFIVHARKAWLNGLNPKQNREIPPLDYDRVYKLKQSFPDLCIVINGGIRSLEDMRLHLSYCDGVMVGRAAYEDSYMLTLIDQMLFGDQKPVKTRQDVLSSFLPYAEAQLAMGTKLHHMTKHILGIVSGCPGAKTWRRQLSIESHRVGAGLEVIENALRNMPEDSLSA